MRSPIYNSTNGDNWSYNRGWKTNGVFSPVGTECNWYGVFCNSDKSRVTGISLAGNKLTGSLPHTVQNLGELRFFHTPNNKLGGTLPNLHAMRYLQRFDVSNNMIGGLIDYANIHDHRSLRIFRIGYNRIRGNVPNPAPRNLIDGESSLCPNLLTPSSHHEWNMAASRYNEAISWHGSYEYTIVLHEIVHLGCKDTLPKARNVEDLLSEADTSYLGASREPRRPDWHMHRAILGAGKNKDERKESGFVHLLRVNPHLEVWPGGTFVDIQDPRHGLVLDEIMKPSEILIFEKPGYVLGNVDIEYRLCAAPNGREPCSAPAKVKLRASGQQIKQTLKFGAPAVNSTFEIGKTPLSATASSERLPTFTSLTPDICKIDAVYPGGGFQWPYDGRYVEAVVKALKFGRCMVQASESSGGIFAPATPITRAFAVDPTRHTQTIIFPVQSVPLFAAGRTFRLVDVKGGNSGNPVLFSTRTPEVCTVTGNVVRMLKADRCVITARQAGKAATASSAGYAPALATSRAFNFSTTKEGIKAQTLNFDDAELYADDVMLEEDAGPVLEKNDAIAVPALGQWSVLLLSLAAAGVGVRRLRRRGAGGLQ